MPYYFDERPDTSDFDEAEISVLKRTKPKNTSRDESKVYVSVQDEIDEIIQKEKLQKALKQRKETHHGN